LLAIATSHFNHSQFTGPSGPRAKVLYARDYSWYYVVVTGGHSYAVYGIRAEVATPGVSALSGYRLGPRLNLNPVTQGEPHRSWRSGFVDDANVQDSTRRVAQGVPDLL
jgi:hypothetical protein